jgi:hypothetical protein
MQAKSGLETGRIATLGRQASRNEGRRTAGKPYVTTGTSKAVIKLAGR